MHEKPHGRVVSRDNTTITLSCNNRKIVIMENRACKTVSDMELWIWGKNPTEHTISHFEPHFGVILKVHKRVFRWCAEKISRLQFAKKWESRLDYSNEVKAASDQSVSG